MLALSIKKALKLNPWVFRTDLTDSIKFVNFVKFSAISLVKFFIVKRKVDFFY